MEFREIIKKARLEKKISQGKLAEMIGKTQAFISEIESGAKTPSLKTGKAIIEALGLSNNDDFRKHAHEIALMHTDVYVQDEKIYHIESNVDENKTSNPPLNAETVAIAQEIQDNPDLRELFEVSKKIHDEDIQTVTALASHLLVVAARPRTHREEDDCK